MKFSTDHHLSPCSDIFGRKGIQKPTQLPPADVPLSVHITVFGPAGIVMPSDARIVLDDGKGYTGAVVGPQVQWMLPAGSRYGWGARLLLKAAGLQDFDDRIALAPDLNVSMQPASVLLPALERRGQFYYRDGAPFSIIETSAFRLYERLLNGENVEPWLENCLATGFNTQRVWLLNTSVGHILPADHPDFYDRLPELLGLCGRYGQYVELTVGTQWADLLPHVEQQQDHYDRTVGALGSAFAFVEGCNEWDAYTSNRFDVRLNLHKPAGATFDLCRGSNGSDSWALEPVIDSARYHSNDAPEWQRRCAHNGYEIAEAFHVPCWSGENTRPDRDGNPDHHFDGAAGATLLSAGSCFHSTSGKNAQPFTGVDRVCAQAWVAGARSVDLSQRTEPYARRDDLNVPGQIIRAYQRGSALVRIRA